MTTTHTKKRKRAGVDRRAVLAGLVAAAAAAGTRAAPAAAAESDELAWTPAWRIREMMVSKKLSPVEYAKFLLARVERNKDLGAFITVFPEHLMDGAKAAEAAIMKGGTLPRLHGLPVSVKDLVWTKGQRTTMGSLLFADFIPDKDSIVIERVRREGGIVFGKTNTPEFGLNRRSVNLVSQEALNPWDPERKRTSGGSSGGSGVAVAAGLGPFSVGTDGGGSIRIPSSFNGIFGLIATRGLTPNGATVFDSPSSIIGPMARDVKDAALLLQAMAGPDDRDIFGKDAKAPPDYLAEMEKGVKGLRVAWSPDFGRVAPHNPAVIDVCHKLATAFKELGAAYDEPSLRVSDPHDQLEQNPEYTMAKLSAQVRKMKGSYKDAMDYTRGLSPEDFAKLTIYVRDRNDRPNSLDYAMSIPPSVRRKPIDRLEDIFKRYDLLVSPVIDRTAFVAGEIGISPYNYTAYCFLANVAGYCACSVPAGFVDGLPVGLHIMARPFDEALLFRAARALEKARPWAQHKPKVA